MGQRVTRLAAICWCMLLFSFTTAVSADWAYRFVVYGSSLYVITNESVSKDLIEERIGEVTSYTDTEGTYRGNFSNYFIAGTGYYRIRGIDISSSIAVETHEGTYIVATYEGAYSESD